MMLTVPDTARLFSVSEETVVRWVREGSIPCARIGEQLRFNRTDLLEWATNRGLRVSVEITGEAAAAGPRLGAALEAGGVFHEVGGHDVRSVLAEVVARMPAGDGVDREELLEILCAREGLGSTGVGDGIAIPHVGRPTVLPVERPSITLCFLAQPVDYGAVDGQPVTAVFAFLTPTVRAHLALLSRLSAALHDPTFRAAVVDRAPAATLLAEARRLDAGSSEGRR